MDLVFGIVRRFPVIILAVGIGVGGFIFRDYMSGSAGDLKVGDCFDVPAVSTEIKDVQHHPCEESHGAEVFAIVTHSAPKGEIYLSDATVTRFIMDRCVPAFRTYTGLDPMRQSELDMGAFYPTSQGWADGDREFVCYLYGMNDQPLTGSRRAAS